MNDTLTILWKEWREVFFQRGSLKKGLLTEILLPVAVLGIFLPLIAKEAWVGTPGLLLYVWMPPYLAIGLVANAFAGERERHTLETLLATRLPNLSILLGKMLAAVTYGVALTMLVALLGIGVVNVVFGHGRFLFFSIPTLIVMVFASLILTSTVASVGTLVSLRAPTMRQAAQRMSFALILPGIVITGAAQFLPGAWRSALFDALAGVGAAPIALAAVLGLVALNVVMFLIALARFKRDKLVLE